MGAKIGSFLATLLLSVPLAAIGLMAVFGVPEIVPGAGGAQGDTIDRGRSLWSTITGENGQQAAPPQGQFGEAPRFAANDQFAPQPLGHNPHVPPAGSSIRPDPYSPSAAPVQPASYAYNDAPQHWSATPRMPGLEQDPRFPNVLQDQPRAVNARDAALAAAQPVSVPGLEQDALGTQLTWQQAEHRLGQLGITNFRIERGLTEGTFVFVCAYSSPESPQVTHRFEAEAADPLAAANQALRQIERWNQRQFQAANFPPRQQRLSLTSDGFPR